ncbi:hypothetical protein CDL12_10387 [Handroanthus impetiginosus]|uniref:Bet v I/Major latex protein domain-containing protein n=1 Tax=Handroanthus impetiginosus TaxID=429701 RepID=A0A2G9HHH8_9LAMI|nr:hypothetical protein CDL12_10387 [Handroanthus impetiginosus]
MGVITYDMEISSSVPTPNALVFDADTFIPKIMPQAVKNVEILEGDDSVGTMKLIYFDKGSQCKSAKHRVDALDTKNLTHSYSIVADGGCICKNRSIYHIKDGVEMSEEKIQGREREGHSDVQGYLEAN